MHSKRLAIFYFMHVVSGTFLVYAAINLAGILFIIMMVPEIKGRTLEHIQPAINT